MPRQYVFSVAEMTRPWQSHRPDTRSPFALPCYSRGQATSGHQDRSGQGVPPLSLHALRHSEGFARAPVPALLLHAHGGVAAANPALVQWLGWTAQDLQAQGVGLLEGEAGLLMATVEAAVLRTEAQLIRLRDREGRNRPCLLLARSVHSQSGELQGLYVQLLDQQRQQTELQSLRTLLQVVPGVAMLTFDCHLKYLEAGGELLRRSGLLPADLIGRRLDEVVPEPTASELRVVYQAILAGQVVSVAQPSRRGDTLLLTGLPVRDPLTDVVTGGLLFGQDLRPSGDAEADAADLAAILDHGDKAVVVCDLTGKVVRWNHGATRLYGWTAQEAACRLLPDLLGPHCYGDGPDPQQNLLGVLASGHWSGTVLHWQRGREPVPVQARLSVAATGQGRLVLVASDQRQQFAQVWARQEAERRFETAFLASSIGIAMVGLDGRWLHVNPRLCDLLGYNREELLATDFQSLTHPEDVAGDVAQAQHLLDSGAGSYRIEKRYLHKSGRVVWTLLTVSLMADEDGRPSYFLSQIQDIADRKASEAMLHELAFRDSLTSLGNRRLLVERLTAQLGRRNELPALVQVDIDRFQVLNDSFGHAVGDLVLCEVARRLHQLCHAEDLATRVAADSFALLLGHARDDLEALAERVRLAATFLMAIGDREVAVAVSVGLVLAQPGDTPEAVLKAADATMLRAKRKGRGRSEVMNAEKRARSQVRQLVERDLQGALSRGEFCLQYQPVVRMDTGELAGFEALVRWQHPTRGLRPPGEFVGVMQEMGLLEALDGYVLDAACSDLVQWRTLAMEHKPWRLLPAEPALGDSTLPWHVSVNLGPEDLQHDDIVHLVAEVLQRCGLPPRQLWIEITETALLEPTPRIIGCVTALRDLGCRIAIDDFGTGYASLSYLQRFPVDVLKIDRSFVSDLGGNAPGSAIVRASLSLATSLGLDVVAEGVETVQQANILRDLGCKYGQGWLFGRPMYGQKVTGRWLSGNRAAKPWPADEST